MCRMILLPLHPSILCSLIVHWLEPKKFRTNLPLLFYFFFLLVRVTLCLWLVGKMLTSQNQLKVFTWVIWAIWHYLGTIHSFLMPHQNGRHHLAQGPLRCKFQSCNAQNFGVLESGHPKGRGGGYFTFTGVTKRLPRDIRFSLDSAPIILGYWHVVRTHISTLKNNNSLWSIPFGRFPSLLSIREIGWVAAEAALILPKKVMNKSPSQHNLKLWYLESI